MGRKASQDGSEEHQAEKRERAEGVVSDPDVKNGSASSLQLLFRMAPDLVFLGVAVFVFLLARDIENPQPGQLSPGFWPQVLSAGIGIFSVVRLGDTLLMRKRPVAQAASNEEDVSDVDEGEVRLSRTALAVALVVGYVFGTIFLGFFLSTALFLIAFIYLGGQRKWYVIPLGILGSLAFVVAFLKVVYVSVPIGVGVFGQFSSIVYRLLGIY